MNKYLRLICLATCLFAIVSCEKNDHPTPKTDITQTIYEPGKEYTRKFYFGSHAIGGYTPETGVHFIYYFFPNALGWAEAFSCMTMITVFQLLIKSIKL